MSEQLDCAIVGGGPGGLTAAVYLARFRRSSLVVDAGDGRARWIPESHNCPGFPSGVSGRDYLARLKLQAREFHARIESGTVDAIERDGDLFVLSVDGAPIRARKVILATGCEDRLPEMERLEEAIGRGAMRLCPVCDGYEAIDLDIAVHGPLADCVDHALFVRTYSPRVTLVPTGDGDGDGDGDDADADADARTRLRAAGVVVTAAARALHFDGNRCSFTIDGGPRAFDVVYPMLGARQRSGLAVSLGASTDDEGALRVDPHQMTSVPGLYAIGDVVSALNQVAVATGHAAVAATHVHNALPANRA